MSVLNNATIVGLFGSDQDVEQAIAHLQEQGFDQKDNEIQVIDEYRLTQESPIDAPPQALLTQPNKGAATGGPVPIFNPVRDAGTEAATVERSTYETLSGMGLDNEEALLRQTRGPRKRPGHC